MAVIACVWTYVSRCRTTIEISSIADCKYILNNKFVLNILTGYKVITETELCRYSRFDCINTQLEHKAQPKAKHFLTRRVWCCILMKTYHVHLHQALPVTAGQFCASDVPNERVQRGNVVASNSPQCGMKLWSSPRGSPGGG